MNKQLKFTQYKELYKLFYEISMYLDAPRYFSKWEINENIKNYIYELLYNGYSTIAYLLNELNDTHDITCENMELAHKLKMAYRLYA